MPAACGPPSADAHQLENAILNVAINARDAMPNGGRLTIETANAYLDEAYARDNTDVEPGQYVMVAITDTGTGMSAETIARVFDPFFTTKPAGTGTGLGLSQVFGFVKQSHGHIKIYSELGAGTTIKIYLPRFMGDAAVATPPAAAPVDTGNAREVILVVEDDELVRRTTIESLSALGYTAVDAESAAQALAVLDSRKDIALLFTDIVMPGGQRQGAGRRSAAAKTRPQGHLHHRLYAERRGAWRRARSRRPAPEQAVHARSARRESARGARQAERLSALRQGRDIFIIPTRLRGEEKESPSQRFRVGWGFCLMTARGASLQRP